MKLRFSLSLFLILVFTSAFAQIPNIRIGPDKVSGYQPCEPSIAISPVNPNIMVAGSILDNVYRSEDGGVTWSHDKLTSSHGVFGDPCVVASPLGDFYYLHLLDYVVSILGILRIPARQWELVFNSLLYLGSRITRVPYYWY